VQKRVGVVFCRGQRGKHIRGSRCHGDCAGDGRPGQKRTGQEYNSMDARKGYIAAHRSPTSS
jgi:hypothetical protein